MIFKLFKDSKNSFEGLMPGESVQLLLREHWFVVLAKVIVFVVMLVLPVFIYPFFAPYLFMRGLLSVSLYILSLYYLFVWFSLFYSLMLYALTVWVVTDKRIIDSSQLSFFFRSVSEMSIEKVQDVQIESVGLFATFLGYGNVSVQSAGADNKFRFDNIPNPDLVRQIILQMHTNAVSRTS